MSKRLTLPFAFVLLASCGDRAVEGPRDVVLVAEESGSDVTPPTYPDVSGTTRRLESKDQAAVRPPPAPLHGPADVRFSSGDYGFAFLKVDDQVLVLEPYAALPLSAGRHDLAVRTDEEDAWQRLQPLALEPGRRYKVRLSRANGWSLEDQGPAQEVDQPAEQPAPEMPVERPALEQPEPNLDPLPNVPSTDNLVDSPVVGYWRETARIPCDGGPAFVPEDPIREFFVWATGDVRVTWRPFETYHDYHGKYQLDLTKQLINISNLDGNYVPTDIDHRGRFVGQKNRLILEDMWLGSSRNGGQPRACGHHFEPTSP